jgi:F-type H+-transporting ATPase subunit b
MISINATLLLQIVHFLVLTFILNRLLFRPILRLINERRGHIETTISETKELELETERLRNEYLTRHENARKEAARERTQLRSRGISEAEEFLSKSRKEVATVRAEADGKAESEFRKTQPLLRDEAARLADVITERVIGRRIKA